MRFYVHGYYGNQNLGDEAILTALVENLRKIWPDCWITIISADEESPKRVGVDRVTDWREGIRSSDVAIFGGGGMFDDAGPRGWRDQVPMFKEIWYAFTLKKPIVFFAVGAGPYHTSLGRIMLATEAWLANLITARDKESSELFLKYLPNRGKVHLTGDLAFLLPEASTENVDANFIEVRERVREMARPRIGVNLFSFSGLVHKRPEEDEKRRRDVAAALDTLLAEGGSAIFVSAQGERDGNDYAEAERTRELMKHGDKCLNIPYFANPALFREIVKEVDCLVGMKLHSLIFAYGALKPVIALSYHSKTASFVRMIGAEGFTVSLDQLSVKELVGLVKTALSEGWQSREEQKARWEELKKSAALNFEILQKYIGVSL